MTQEIVPRAAYYDCYLVDRLMEKALKSIEMSKKKKNKQIT